MGLLVSGAQKRTALVIAAVVFCCFFYSGEFAARNSHGSMLLHKGKVAGFRGVICHPRLDPSQLPCQGRVASFCCPLGCWRSGFQKSPCPSAPVSCPHKALTGEEGVGVRPARDQSLPLRNLTAVAQLKSTVHRCSSNDSHTGVPLPLGLFLKNLELFKFYSPTTSNPRRK